MRKRVLIVALLSAVLIWAALWWRNRSVERAAMGAAPADTTGGGGVVSVRLYFAAPDGQGLVSEPREVVRAEDLRSRVATLVGDLDRGPRSGGVAVLPSGTELRHAFLDSDGLLTVDLSLAFRRGFQGGSTSEYWAIASLVRTLAANLPEVKRVLVLCSGQPLETLGGHVPLDEPLKVEDWQ